MTELQKITLRQSECRSRLGEILALEGDAYTEEVKAEERSLQAELQTLEQRHRSAVLLEPAPTNGQAEPDAEGRELASLESRVSMSRLLEHRAHERQPDGAELELLQHRGSDVAKAVPLDLLLDNPVETRATTSGPTSTTASETWIDRAFSPSVAMWAGSSFSSVGPGEKLYHSLSAGPSVAEKAEGAASDQTAGTISTKTVKPVRVPGSYRWSVESASESPGLEAAIRRDLRGLLTEGIDQLVIDDLVGVETPTDMSAQLTVALLRDLVAAEVDGKYAVDEMAVKLLCNATVMTRLMATTLTNEDDTDGAAWMRRHTGGLRVSDKMPAAASGISDSVFVRTSVRSTSMVNVWRDAEVVLDPYTRASQGERVLTIFSLVNHDVVDAGAYSVQGIKTTT